MKRCSKCGLDKNEIEFSKHNRYADGLNCWCKDCVRAYAKENYRKNNTRYKEYQREHLLESRVHNRTWHEKKRSRLNQFKTKCVKCGDDRLYLIDFHHINPTTKSGNLSNMCLKVSDEVLVEEIKKCVCLCRNCHFEFHYLYGNKPISPIENLTEYIGGDPYEIQLQSS